MEDLQAKLYALIALFMMIIADYYIGNQIWNFVSAMENTTLMWILFASMTLSVLIGTFGIPILIATGEKINPLNGILAYAAIWIIIPIEMILVTFVWDFAESLLTTDLLAISQLTIILLIIIFAFIYPLGIILTKNPIMGSESG